jgi:anaerobic magnesium-protoporphyrin IX monomethyl ester cyclase
MGDPRVVFVRPPNLQKSGQWKKQGVVRCPLNIALLASFIRARGRFECLLLDFEVIPAVSVQEMADLILKESPRYVCLTTLTPRFPVTVRVAQEIKKRDPKVIIIVGGAHVTGAPASSLFEGIDYGIIGEGEEALLELLNTLERGSKPDAVKNLVYRSNGQPTVNECRPYIRDLDALPLPAWDLMRLPEYTDPAYFEGSHLAIYASRGCPYDCSFCASAVTWKRQLRLRSVDSVIGEIRHIVNVLGVNNLMFWDDDFAANEKWALEICRRMVDENLRVGTTVQLRADSISEALIKALKMSGCRFAAIGVESGNEEMLVKIGKKENKDQLRKAIRMMKDLGLPSIASYIIGLPGDTHATIRETMDFAFELDADQSKFMILAAFPGTRVYELACAKGLVDPLSFDQMEATNYYDSVSVNLSSVSNEDLLRYQDEAYERFDKIRVSRENNKEEV